MPDQLTSPNGTSHPRRWGWLVLFTSSTALVCCVIPIVLVSLGFGAAVAALYGNLPILTFIGRNDNAVLALTALILLAAGWALYRPGRNCPAEPKLALECQRADRWNRRLFLASCAIWLVSFFFAKLLLPLSQWLGLV